MPFLSKLPKKHAILTMQKTKATLHLRSDTLFNGQIPPLLPHLRELCAAMAWIHSDSYSKSAVAQLDADERRTLLQLFGLITSGGRKFQTQRIDAYILAHDPTAAAAAPTAASTVSGHDHFDAGHRNQPPPDRAAADIAIAALVSPSQLLALNAMPLSALSHILQSADFPYHPDDSESDRRLQVAMATWIVDRPRTVAHIRALPTEICAQLLSTLQVPAAWPVHMQDATLQALIEDCSASSWANQSDGSGGNLPSTRLLAVQALHFLRAEAVSAAPSSLSSTMSSLEAAEYGTLLSQSGHSESELLQLLRSAPDALPLPGSHDDPVIHPAQSSSASHLQLPVPGSASLPITVEPGSSTIADSGTASASLEAIHLQVRSLHIDVQALLTVEELKTLHQREKSAGKKRQKAFEDDDQDDDPAFDPSACPLAGHPWNQVLSLRDAFDPDLWGRQLNVASRWFNEKCTDPLMNMIALRHSDVAARLLKEFKVAVQIQDSGTALLLVSQAHTHARKVMSDIQANAVARSEQYPQSKLLAAVAIHRTHQLKDVNSFLDEIMNRISNASHEDKDNVEFVLGAHFSFLQAWLSKSIVPTKRAELVNLVQQLRTSGPVAEPTACAPPSLPSKTALPSTPVTTRRQTNLRGAPRLFTTVCDFGVHIPSSINVIGKNLGISCPVSCKICRQGDHYHGECPVQWAKAGKPLPGFNSDGTRDAKAWKNGEILQHTVKLWILFLQNKDNFAAGVAIPAGATGAPTLETFKARLPAAPTR